MFMDKSQEAHKKPNIFGEYYAQVCPHCGEEIRVRDGPKQRLTVREDRVLKLLLEKGFTNAKRGLKMRQILKLYRESYNDMDAAAMSQTLKELRLNGFLSYAGHTPTMTSKTQQRWSTPKKAKMINWVSDAVLLGELKVDQDRWIIYQGSYVADKATRKRIEAREAIRHSKQP